MQEDGVQEDGVSAGEQGRDERAVAERDADALTSMALDVLGPAVAFWRVEAARRLGLDASSLACLDLLRRHGRVSAGVVRERTGLTRSSVSKLLRRLEQAGHVDLVRDGERDQVVEVRMRPNPGRDAELARMREELRFRLRYVASYGIDEEGRAAGVRLLRHCADAVHSVATRSVDQDAEVRRVEARRRREAESAAW